MPIQIPVKDIKSGDLIVFMYCDLHYMNISSIKENKDNAFYYYIFGSCWNASRGKREFYNPDPGFQISGSQEVLVLNRN